MPGARPDVIPADPAFTEAAAAARRERVARKARERRIAAFIDALIPLLAFAPVIVGPLVSALWIASADSLPGAALAIVGGAFCGLGVAIAVMYLNALAEVSLTAQLVGSLVSGALGMLAGLVAAVGIVSLIDA